MVKAEPNQPLKYSIFMPRIWHGMPAKVWFSNLARNRFAFSWSRLHYALGVSAFCPVTSMLAIAQKLGWSRAIAKTELERPPIFILGHWRSGTTLLHEYLGLDPRFASPTTYQCFAPWHFLLTEGLVTRYGNWLLPDRRPMDNMKAGWALPQEDEFALMNLGAPSPYLRLMFPNHPVPYTETLDSSRFRPADLQAWRRQFEWFVKALTYKTRKQLLLKSPPHTGRIGTLRQMYPDSKFIHIVRDPRKLYPSTMKLWNSLDENQALQSPTDQSMLQSFVMESLVSMYRAFDRDRANIPESQIIDIRFEQFIAQPVQTLEEIYKHLDLGQYDTVRSNWENKSEQERGYQTNKLQIDTEQESMILDRWSDYARKYGYLDT
ncbi:MAG: sulfotransferase family protein [Planctomycetota bacterium]